MNKASRIPKDKKTTQKRNVKATMSGRLGFFVFILMVGVALLFGRLTYLQVWAADELRAKNTYQVEGGRKLQSPRGTISDRQGRPLAVSAMAKSLYADPTLLAKKKVDLPELANLLAPYTEYSEEELLKLLQEDTAFVWLNRMMEQEASDAVKKIIKEHKIEGLNFVDESKRYYPNGNIAAQVLGFVGIDDKGLDGIEMVFDKDIKGNIIHEVISQDRRGNPIFESVFTKFQADKEKSLTLTIDTTVQFIAERALDKAMAQTKASGASIIIMDPKTGEILAMANRPTYDPNKFFLGTTQDFKNRSVIDIYEPGSTFKPIVAAAALDSGVWHVNDTYRDSGYFVANGETIRNWDNESNGEVRLLDILKYSINTGMAHIGTSVGPERLNNYAHAFGFGKVTGIELPGEGEGILFNTNDMQLIDAASMSIGQGIAVTPLQMVQAFGALANHGQMMKPHIVKSINNPDGSIAKSIEPVSMGNPISAEVAEIMMDILEKEVSEGGGAKAHVEGYKFAGKTGTAQKLNIEHGGYLEGRYISSFIGFGPVEDARFVALIVIDDPEGVFYGGQIAAPVFKDIMSQLVRYYQISPSVTKPQKEEKEEYITVPVRTNDEGEIILPDFTGWSIGEVRQWLSLAGLVFKPVGSGYAISQEFPGGSTLKEKQDITVYFKR